MRIDEKYGIRYNTNTNIIIDTNVLVSGLQSDLGYSNRLLSMLPSDDFTICVSVPLVLEYEAQLTKHLPPEIFTKEDINTVIDFLCQIAKKVPIYYLWRPHLKDPFDDHILELAFASESKYIISFNKKDFRGIGQYGLQVVTPKEFIQIIEQRR